MYYHYTGCSNCLRASLFNGMERWNGTMEWNGGMEWNDHAHVCVRVAVVATVTAGSNTTWALVLY